MARMTVTKTETGVLITRKAFGDSPEHLSLTEAELQSTITQLVQMRLAEIVSNDGEDDEDSPYPLPDLGRERFGSDY